MFPTSLPELLLFVALLAPGLAFVLRHERVFPARSHSPFRETLRVFFVSVACLSAAALVGALLRWRFPRGTPDVGALVRDPAAYSALHYQQIAWWSAGLLLFATILGAIAADRRVVHGLRRVAQTRAIGWITGTPTIGTTSVWYELLHFYDDEPDGRVWVGLQIDDGTYIDGELAAFNTGSDEHENRDIAVWNAAITVDGERKTLDQLFTVVSARRLVRVDITHLGPELPQTPRQGDPPADEVLEEPPAPAAN